MPKRLLTKFGKRERKPEYVQPEPIAEDIKIMFETVKIKKIKKLKPIKKSSKIK